MEIRTKFEIKQKLYGLYYWQYKWHITEFICTDIHINDIGYIIYGYNRSCGYMEQNCFATYEEAQKECERRNANKI